MDGSNVRQKCAECTLRQANCHHVVLQEGGGGD